jgi:hypothetical protein
VSLRRIAVFAAVASLGLAAAVVSDASAAYQWAHPYTRGNVRHVPDAAAKPFTRLHFHTEDGPLEVYPVFGEQTDAAGRRWLKIGVPGRPNGRTGWVVDEALGPLHTVHTRLRINRRTLRATLYKRDRRIWQSRVGVGKRSTPTPRGHFWIRERLKALGGLYGPWAFGTSAYSVLTDWPGGGVVGIHGTNQPELIPGRPSHGCVRVPNKNIRRLARLMPVGTPVEIL